MLSQFDILTYIDKVIEEMQGRAVDVGMVPVNEKCKVWVMRLWKIGLHSLTKGVW